MGIGAEGERKVNFGRLAPADPAYISATNSVCQCQGWYIEMHVPPLSLKNCITSSTISSKRTFIHYLEFYYALVLEVDPVSWNMYWPLENVSLISNKCVLVFSKLMIKVIRSSRSWPAFQKMCPSFLRMCPGFWKKWEDSFSENQVTF